MIHIKGNSAGTDRVPETAPTHTYGNSATATGSSSALNVVLVKYDPSGAAQWAQSVQGGVQNSRGLAA